MAVNLTPGAIDMICNGDTEIKPYLQVTEVRLVSDTNQTSTNERFRMLVSDGTHTQQAMLATQRNDLVKSGRLQRGSIVKLLQFVCNLIQNRKIIIIIELEVVQDVCDFIGQPTLYVSGGARPAQLPSSAGQTPALNGNPQYGNAESAGSSIQPPLMERRPEVQPYGSPYANNPGTGRFAPTNPSMYARPGFSPESTVTSNPAGGYNNSMTGASHYSSNIRPARQQQPPTMYMNRGPIAKIEAAPRIVPINTLNPYQGRWTIKARVTAKSDLRRYSNARGDGKVFNFNLLDSDQGEIRVTCFNAVADQFFNLIEVGRVYLISKGTLKPAQKAFNHLPNDYEISLDSTSSVQPVDDEVQPYGSPYANNPGTVRFAPTNPSMYARPGFIPESTVTSNPAGGYNNSMTGASHYSSNIRPAHQQQPPTMYMNRGPIAKNEAAPRIVPIKTLNPYQGRWTIKARVTAKSDLRRYSNARGDGKVFNFDLLDFDQGEIRITCFNAVADQFFNLIEVGRVYLISKGTLKPAQKAFNHLPNDYEISLDSTSSVQPVDDEVQPYGSPYANNPGTERFAPTNPSMYARPGFSPESTVTSNPAGGYNNSMTGASHYSSNIRPAHQQQPPTMYMNRGPIAKNEAAPRIVPIKTLNPYQGRWTIKARVTAKSDLRRYSNARGDGKVFNFDLLDFYPGEIRVTCFNAVADQFFNLIEVGRVYLISKGTLKPAQKAFNHLPNDYEISLDSTSSVQPVDDETSIPRQQFRFRPISDVEGMEKNNVVDIIGIVSSITPSTTIIKKDTTETQKRSLQLRDMSGKSVEVTLWGDFCNSQGHELQSMCDSGHNPVLAVKSGRVNDFNGKAVGTVSNTQLFIEPDFPEAGTLRNWFDTEGRNTPSVLISREGSGFSRTEVRKAISQIKDEKLGTSEKPDYIMVCAQISFIKVDNFCYTACPLMSGDRKCSKKVTNNGDGKWRCERCDQEVDECEYRYILQFQIQDHTGLTWVSTFQECAEQILCVSAKELYSLKYEEQDDDRFNEYICRALFSKYLFKLKVKEETFSDEVRVKSTVMKLDPVDYSSETRFLLGLLTNQTPEPPINQATNATNYGGVAVNQGTQYVSCSSCGGFGHNPANCPSVMSAPSGYSGRTPPSQTPVYSTGGGGGGECFKCHQSGHWAKDCPGSSAVPQFSGDGGGGGECFKCHQTGHWARDCPNAGAGNQYGSSAGGGNRTGGECFKCHQSGHWAKDCPGSSAVRQFSGDGGGGGECFKCHQTGHWARDCPNAGAGNQYGSSAGGGNRTGGECFKSHQSGHWAKDCPGSSAVPQLSGDGGGGECFKCHQTGHWTRDCPNAGAGNQYGSSAGGGYRTGGECFKSHQSGHWAKDCPGSSAVPQFSGDGGGGGECFKCHQTGHWARDCPNAGAGNQYGSSAGGGYRTGGGGGECFKCHQQGYWSKDCPGINSVPPAYGMQR